MTDAKKRFSVEAELDEFVFPRVLWFLIEHNVTGRLVLRRGEITKVVFMVEGRPVNVDSTLRDETLGRYLIKKGRITEQDFGKSIELMVGQNIQQGAALVKLGCISAKDLYHEVKAQNQAKLVSCFAWTTGSFGFYPEVDFVEDIYRFEIAPAALMKEGICRFFPPGAVEAQLARVKPGPILPTPGFPDAVGGYDLDEEESAFVMMIDGERDLLALKDECVKITGSAKLLYTFLVCGLIGPGGVPDDSIRGLGGRELILPPIEEFVIPSESAPEVIEEEWADISSPGVVREQEAPEEGPEESGRDFDFADELGEDMVDAGASEESEDVFSEGEFGLESDEAGAAMDESDELPPLDEDLPSDEDYVEGPDLAGDEDEFEAPPEPAGPEIEEDIEVEFPPLDEEPEEEEPPPEPEYEDESAILETYMTVKSSDFFALLGLGRDAGDLDVDRAYRLLRKQWDKERFSPAIGAEAQAKLEEINAQIIRAYENIRTAGARRSYLKELDKTKAPPARPALEAEQLLQKGMGFVRQRDWANAQAMFEKAVEARPNEPEYLGYLGWTIYSNPETDLDERKTKAKKLLRKAIDTNPNMDSARVFLAKIMKEEGDLEGALVQFQAALKANPKCREAERELKAHDDGEW